MSVRIDQNAGSGAEAAAPTPGRWGAISTGIGPVLLLAAFLWHAPIPRPASRRRGGGRGRGGRPHPLGLAHFVAVLASAAIAVAFVAVSTSGHTVIVGRAPSGWVRW
jgi:hypothetical protein